MQLRTLIGIFVACLLLCFGGIVRAEKEEGTSSDEEVLKAANVSVDAAGLVEFFRKLTPTPAEEEKIKKLIQKLGDDEFEAREDATKKLKDIGPVAIPFLRDAAKTSDFEVVRRAETCLASIKQTFSPTTVAAAGRLAAVRKPAGMCELLLGYLPHAEDEFIAEEVRTTLSKLAVRDGKPDAALVDALKDKSAVKRAAAGVALARSGRAELLPEVHKLLGDANLEIRLRVGLALAATKDKKAIPVLIDLLDGITLAQMAPIEELLYRLGEDKQLPNLAGKEPAARRKYKDEWSKWWTDNQDKIDLARAETPKLLGHTLMVLLDKGTIMEVDANKKKVWEVTGIQFPLDVQYLPGGRLLLAEQQAGRVTERSLDGKVIWEKEVSEPLVAQRLPNGNTFIGSRNGLVEFDAKDNEVFKWSLNGGDQVMRAQRMPNGEIACVVQRINTGIEYVHLDRTGKELRKFRVNIATFGGRVQLLPNGRVLIPEMHHNRVVEYDTEGKVVWEAAVDQPIVATRLPNGNTLVTSMNQQRPRALEIDRDGKEVWEFHNEKNDSRVTRALRR